MKTFKATKHINLINLLKYQANFLMQRIQSAIFMHSKALMHTITSNSKSQCFENAQPTQYFISCNFSIL